MAKRGPGKFNDDLDAAIYSLSLDGGADEEASYGEGQGFYGLMRDGAGIAKAIEERRGFAPEEVEGVDATELAYLRKKGSAGVIFYERSDGIVEVSYYDSKSALDKDWEEVLAETASEDEELEPNGQFTIYLKGQRGDDEPRPHGGPLSRVKAKARELIKHGFWKATVTGPAGDVVAEFVRVDASGIASPHGTRVEERTPTANRRRNAQLSKVGSKYGAQMGRDSQEVHGNVTLELVRIDSGGYDGGGAYWGTGEPLWRAQDEDGNEKFFRASSREAARQELEGDDCTVIPGSPDRQNEGDTSKLETDGTLDELLDMQAETNEFPHSRQRELEITPELSAKAVEYEAALWTALSELVSRYRPMGDADANTLMEDGDAPANVFLTLAGHGVGIWDGRWNAFYDNDMIEKKVQPFLESKLGGWVSDSGSGKLVQALDNAVYENERRLGIERDDENNVIEREENRRGSRHRPNGSTAWIVLLNGEETDVAFMASDMDADDVKRSLVNHDGYDPRITVKKRERRRTHAPDSLAENARRRRAH